MDQAAIGIKIKKREQTSERVAAGIHSFIGSSTPLQPSHPLTGKPLAYSSARSESPSVHHAGQYRPDIDGLRALAVLSVFFYHLLPARFPAGGIGVDIFFVISGYLIGGILLREIGEGTFSFRTFYERRFRRIAPAFLVVVFTTTWLGYFLLLPDDWKSQSWASIAALLSVSNFYFWKVADYFDQRSAEQPLLHTWSLSVEEQFYIFTPFVLIAAFYIARKQVALILITLTLMSFALSVWLVTVAPQSAFYLPTSRAWELLIGVNLHLLNAKFLYKRKLREIAALLASAGLAVSFVTIHPSKGFPGYAALLPCISTALLILCGQYGQTTVGRFLSLKPALFVGLISYSLYLWHWPAIVFVREYLVIESSAGAVIPASVGIAFALASLSWRYVERPFRSGRHHLPIFSTAAVLVAVLIGFQVWVIANDGFTRRIPDRALQIIKFPVQFDQRGSECLVVSWEKMQTDNKESCLTLDANKDNIVLIGDSHAAMMRTALAEVTQSNVLLLAIPACDIAKIHTSESDCANFIRGILNDSIDWSQIKNIFIAARWNYSSINQASSLFDDLKTRAPVTVIGPTPEYEIRVPKLLAKAEINDDAGLIGKSLRGSIWSLDEQLSAIAAKSSVTYLSPSNAMCFERKTCMVAVAQEPLYTDRDHLSVNGARALLELLLRKNSQ